VVGRWGGGAVGRWGGGADWIDRRGVGRDRGEKGGRGKEILGGWGVRRRVLGRGV